MNSTFDTLIQQAMDQLEDSANKDLLGNLLQDCLQKQQQSLSELLQAKQDGLLSQEDFDAELEREKKILEAEMLTHQITAKASIQKIVNHAIQSLSKGLI